MNQVFESYSYFALKNRFCPQCKENREAIKQIALWRLPQILVIQLKRFSFRNIIWRDKIDRMVHYPINGLDISEFYCRTEYDPEFRPIYDLYAVVNHFGGMFGGHYTAFAKSSNNFENLGINRLLINKIIYYFKF
jgi:ubiquitin C-terminal hydrolase